MTRFMSTSASTIILIIVLIVIIVIIAAWISSPTEFHSSKVRALHSRHRDKDSNYLSERPYQDNEKEIRPYVEARNGTSDNFYVGARNCEEPCPCILPGFTTLTTQVLNRNNILAEWSPVDGANFYNIYLYVAARDGSSGTTWVVSKNISNLTMTRYIFYSVPDGNYLVTVYAGSKNCGVNNYVDPANPTNQSSIITISPLEGCSTNADCPFGQLCIDGNCTTTCTTNADCPSGKPVCSNGTCIAGCSSSADCPNGQTCVNGQCSGSCGPCTGPPTGEAGGILDGTYPNPSLRAAGPTTIGPIGTSTTIPVISVDANGRITSLTSVPAAGGGGGPPTGAAGGALGGTYPNPIITPAGLQTPLAVLTGTNPITIQASSPAGSAVTIASFGPLTPGQWIFALLIVGKVPGLSIGCSYRFTLGMTISTTPTDAPILGSQEAIILGPNSFSHNPSITALANQTFEIIAGDSSNNINWNIAGTYMAV